jgi:small subunit ribosomal protein S5
VTDNKKENEVAAVAEAPVETAAASEVPQNEPREARRGSAS